MSSFAVFPLGWEIKEIKETSISVIDGDRGKQYPAKSDFQREGFCLFLNTSNIKEDSFELSNCDFISEKKDSLLKKGKLQRHDIVLTTRGTVGSTAYFHGGVPFENIRINSGMVIFRATGEVLPPYLYQLLKSSLLKTQYELYSSGSAQPQLPIKDLRRIKLPIPPPDTQRKIAAILTAYDDLIETNKRRIALLEKMAEELYREWFVRMRFPGHENTKFVKGVPEGWEVRKIEKAFEFTGGGTPTKAVSSYWNEGTVNWFTPTDITSAAGIFLSNSEDQCSEEGLARSSAKIFPAYSVMMTSRATIGAIGINTTPACTNQGFITCIPNANYPLPYLYQWLKLAKPYFEQLCGGATFPELTKGTFKKLGILTPPMDLTKRFAEISNPILKSIEFQLEQNQYITHTRDLLLPRLISGKLSVEDLNIQFPPSMTESLLPNSTHDRIRRIHHGD